MKKTGCPPGKEKFRGRCTSIPIIVKKTEERNKLIELINDWFYSDLDIDFYLKKRGRKLLCTLENDAWYEHKGDGRITGVPRHEGKHRRLIVKDGPDSIYDDMKHLTTAHSGYKYTKEETIQLIKDIHNPLKFDIEVL